MHGSVSVSPEHAEAETALYARRRAYAWVAIWIWSVAFVITIALVLSKYLHPLPYGVYAHAGKHWLRHEPLYDLTNIDGFQYFPQAAIVFSAFARLSWTSGNIAWRAINWFFYAWSLWRVIRRF